MLCYANYSSFRASNAMLSMSFCTLQEYSNWPTYPQLYANAELVGGCDIVLELAASKQLKAAVDEALGTSATPQDPKAALHARLKQLLASHSVMLFMKVGCRYLADETGLLRCVHGTQSCNQLLMSFMLCNSGGYAFPLQLLSVCQCTTYLVAAISKQQLHCRG